MAVAVTAGRPGSSNMVFSDPPPLVERGSETGRKTGGSQAGFWGGCWARAMAASVLRRNTARPSSNAVLHVVAGSLAAGLSTLSYSPAPTMDATTAATSDAIASPMRTPLG